MKRRTWLALLVVGGILAASSIAMPQVVTNPVTTVTAPKFSAKCKDSKVFCVGKEQGAEFATVCGMTVGGAAGSSCGTATDATCVAGSALAAATTAGCTVASPCTILIGPGRYDECVAVNNLVGVSFIGTGDNTIVRPTVTAFNSVAGGVFRIGTTGSAATVTDIELANFYIHSDATNLVEAALQLGQEVTVGSAYARINVHDMLLVGNSSAVLANGATTGVAVPSAEFSNVRFISGGHAIRTFNTAKISVRDSSVLAMTNWCESTDSAGLSAIGPTAVNAGAGSTTTVRLQAADQKADDFYAGRKITFGGGAGCPADGQQRWETDYVNSTNLFTFTPAAAGTLDDADCTYTIASVPNAASTGLHDYLKPGCTDIDWTILRAGVTAGGYMGTGCHMNDLGTAPIQGADLAHFENVSCRVEINDFGPFGANCFNPQAFIEGFLWLDRSSEEWKVVSSDAVINLNVDTRDDNTGCATPIVGVGITGGSIADSIAFYSGNITINNRADEDEDVVGILASSTSATVRLAVPQAFIDINTTVGGYSGTAYHLYEGGSSTLLLGDVAGDSPLVTSGTPSGIGRPLTGTATLDFDFTGGADQDTCQAAQTISVPGAVLGDIVVVGSERLADTELNWRVWVSAADTVSVQGCCILPTDCFDTASAVWNVRVEKP